MIRRGSSALAWAALDLCVCLILVIYTLIAPPTKHHPSIPTQGAYAITQTCPKNNMSDVDLYVRDPQHETVYFSATTAGLMHLEQDAIPGQTNIEGTYRTSNADDERVILRGTIPGEYVINEHMYNKMGTTGPETCTIQLWDLRQGYNVIQSAKVTLGANGAVQTPFRFTVNSDGSVTGYSHVPLDIVTPAGG